MSLLKIYQCDICHSPDALYTGVGLIFDSDAKNSFQLTKNITDPTVTFHICLPCVVTLRKELNREWMEEVRES